MPTFGSRRRGTLLVAVALVAGLAVANDGGKAVRDASPSGASWAPRAQTVGGLRVLATTDGDRYLLHTAGGDVDFIPGVNLGSTTPGHQPGELAIGASDYRRWFGQMGQLGFRAVRVYTIHRPQFYAELARYNNDHPDAPLYLMQGVYLPDETYVDTQNLFDAAPTAAFAAEIADAVAAVHGSLTRSPRRGRASGSWRTDVSRWLAGWIIGVEWDPTATNASDIHNADRAAHQGRYFSSVPGASPTESWLAARLDQLAAAEAARGVAVPLAFVNWPTTDALRHPDEPNNREDLVGIDANHIQPSTAWPGGYFASYHAYPYYPDFQRHQADLYRTVGRGRPDPYAGYLAALRSHHHGIPVLVTEFGVPSSIGSAHRGPLGRDQGDHSEQEAMAIDADLLRVIRREGMAGAFLFAWTDEWFKLTWNTMPRQDPPDRRQLWHDPWTNEQWFGVVAVDAGPPRPQWRVVHEARTGIREIAVATDECWVRLRVRLDAAPADPIRLGFDVLDGGAAHLPGSGRPDGRSDFALVLDPRRRTGQAWVRPGVDPLALDFLVPPGTNDPVDGWDRQVLSQNRTLRVPTTGEQLAYEVQQVGALRYGSWDPADRAYDSRSTWRIDGREVSIRIPWLELGIADPSSKRALAVHGSGAAVRPSAVRPRTGDALPPGAVDTVPPATGTVPVERIGITAEAGAATATGDLRWSEWNRVRYRERLKAGYGVLVAALRETAR